MPAVLFAVTSTRTSFSPTRVIPSGFFEVSSLTVYVPGTRLSTVTSLDTPFVIVIVSVALTFPSESLTSNVYVPSALVPVVSFPFTVTFFLIFRLPTSVLLFVNSAVGILAVLFAVTSTLTSLSPTRAIPSGFFEMSSLTMYVPGTRSLTCTSLLAPFVIVIVCVDA